MSEPSTRQPRPRQVTVSGWLVLIGSVFVLVMAFQQIASLGTLEAQEDAARIAREPAVHGLGLSADGVRTMLRVLALLAGAGAAASAVSAVMLLRRRARSDRLALTVIAPVLLVAGLSVAGVMAGLVALGVCYLWTSPARAWFDGRAPTPSSPPAPPPASPGSAPREGPRRAWPEASPPPSGGSMPPWYPAESGYPPMPSAPPPTYPRPWPQAVPGLAPEDRRPGAVVAACVVTWVACGLAVAVALMALLVLSVAPDEFFRQLHEQDPSLADQGLTDHQIRVAGLVGSAITLVWSAVAAVLAVLVFRRVRWSAVALLVCSAIVGLLCAVSLLGSAAAALPLGCAAATVWLLSKPESRAWLQRRRPLG